MVRILFFQILPSLLDLGSDILNALDMIFAGKFGQEVGAGSGSCPEFMQNFLNMCAHQEKDFYDNESLQRKICGLISLSLVFLPGVVKALKVFAKHVKSGEYSKMPKVLIYLPYPLYVFYIQLKAFFNPRSDKHQRSLLRALSMEAFYESFPQLVLQIITIIYKYRTSTVQLISISFSFIMLAKTVMHLDSFKSKLLKKQAKAIKEAEETYLSGDDETNPKTGCCNNACGKLCGGLSYIFWVLPLYATSVLYKIAAFSLTIAYLRLWAIGTMLLLLVELIMLAYFTGLNECALWIYPVFSNFFIVNIGTTNLEQKEEGEDIKNMTNMYTFAKRSVILSFFHHTLVLLIIIWLVLEFGTRDLSGLIIKDSQETITQFSNAFVYALNNTKIHWAEMEGTIAWLKFSPPCTKPCGKGGVEERLQEIRFIILFSSVILIGLFNLLLSIYSARDIKAKRDLSKTIGQPPKNPASHFKRNDNDYKILVFDKEVTAVVECMDKTTSTVVKSVDEEMQTEDWLCPQCSTPFLEGGKLDGSMKVCTLIMNRI